MDIGEMEVNSLVVTFLIADQYLLAQALHETITLKAIRATQLGMTVMTLRSTAKSPVLRAFYRAKIHRVANSKLDLHQLDVAIAHRRSDAISNHVLSTFLRPSTDGKGGSAPKSNGRGGRAPVLCC